MPDLRPAWGSVAWWEMLPTLSTEGKNNFASKTTKWHLDKLGGLPKGRFVKRASITALRNWVLNVSVKNYALTRAFLLTKILPHTRGFIARDVAFFQRIVDERMPH